MHEMGARDLSSASGSLLAGGRRCIAALLGEGGSSRQPKPFGCGTESASLIIKVSAVIPGW